jgi:formyl-CoA transferase
MSVNGFPDHGPVKAGVAFVDFLGGSHLYGAITTALYERERTGRGRLVEVAMVDVAYLTLATHLGSWHQHGEVQRTGNKHAALGVAPYDVYPCADGHVALIAVTDRHWRSVLGVIGRPDLLDDERYRRHGGRAARMDEVDGLVTAWLASRTRDEAVGALQAARVPVAAVRVVDEVIRDERQHARGALQWIDHPELGVVPLPAGPIRWHGSDSRPIEPSRPVGADTAAVLAELAGMSAEEIERLARDGVV